MFPGTRFLTIAFSLMPVFAMANTAMACSSCGCTFNSDWASEGYTNDQGFRFDARFSYIDQSQLRTGTKGVSHSDYPLPNDEEIQQNTTTRETDLGLDYSGSRYWGVHVGIPVIDRTHTTIESGETEDSKSATEGFGDLRIVGRYQGFTTRANLGVQFGIKLPTGAFRDDFSEGPAAGEPIDRGLQNGTGTTDFIFGVYDFGKLESGVGYFLNSIVDQPFASRDGFQPGTSVTTSTGLSYDFQYLTPQLQVNYHFEARETGENSDHPNSGGNFIYLSPGITTNVSPELAVYSLVQIPVFQHVNGLQLEPHAIWSVGARYTF